MKKSAARKPVSVLIADASRMGCEMMSAALRRCRSRITVVGYATDAVGIRQVLRKTEVDIAVISARLRDGAIAGFDLAREIRATQPRTRVIMILDSTNGAMVIEGFRAGASGILSREEPVGVLCKCVLAVYQGEVWAKNKDLRFVLDALAQPPLAQITDAKLLKRPNLLTKREESVVRLVAEGLTNRDISQQLKLSENTVRNYVFRIFNKLGTSNRLELALYVLNRKESAIPNHGEGDQPLAY
jgi:DNA-binding NarL/FixJ family response regulator